MKPTTPATLMLVLALAPPILAQDGAAKTPAATPASAAPAATPTAADADPAAQPVPSSVKLTLDFHGARLGKILDYLSKEAGYVLANPVDLPAPVTLVSKQPLSPAEAVDALNAVLLDQGYAVLVRGRTLRVVTLAQAKQQNLQVSSGSDPAKIPESDRMVTQVIPVKFASVKDLADNLRPLLNNTYSTLDANESSNALIMTDTQANVRRIAAIVTAVDGAISGDQQVKVFHLAHASSDKVAQVLNTIYNSKSGSGGQDIFRSFGFGGGGGGGRGGNGGGGNAAGKDAGGHGDQVAAASDSGTNSVVIRASPGSLTQLAAVIEQLDVDTTAREGVLVYQVHNAKSATLAQSLTNLFSDSATSSTNSTTAPQRNGVQNRQVQGASAAATSGGDAALDLTGQVKVVSDDLSNSVLVLTQERNFDRMRKILETLDRPLRQVLVRVLMAEVSVEKDLDIGVELQGVNPGGDASRNRVFSNFNTFSSSLGMNGYVVDNSQFQATVRALATATKFNVISRPYVLTTDNQKATVFVGQTVPIITGTRTDVNNNVSNTVNPQDVGITLNVTPQISSDGHVVLDVDQALTAVLQNQGTQISPGVIDPYIDKRQMTTRVSVDNGQTVVIGGLVRDDFTETVQKIPLLGDIPYAGALFRRTQRQKVQTELLMFLTPQVVQTPEEMASMTRQLHAEMQHLSNAVEPGVLDRHLRQLQGLKVGQPVAPGTVQAPISVPPPPPPPGTGAKMLREVGMDPDPESSLTTTDGGKSPAKPQENKP